MRNIVAELAAALRVGTVAMLGVMAYVVARLWLAGELDVAAVLLAPLMLGAAAAITLTANGLAEGVRQLRSGAINGLLTMGMSLLPTASIAWAIHEALSVRSVLEVPGAKLEAGIAIAMFAVVATLFFNLGTALSDAKRLSTAIAKKFVGESGEEGEVIEIY